MMDLSIALEMTIDVDAPPSVVWPFIVDWENLGKWMLEASGFEVQTKHREGEGVLAEATIRIGPISTIDRIRVTQWNPPFLLGLDHIGWVKGTGRMELHTRSVGTHLVWNERLIPPWGLLGALGIRSWKPLMRRAFIRDLRTLKRLVESEQER